MKLNFTEEPDLVFARGISPCPRAGIARHDVYDSRFDERHNRVIVGGVGTSGCIDKLATWFERCRLEIPAKESRQPNLFPAFCGFQPSYGFKAELHFSDRMARTLTNSEIAELLKIPPAKCLDKAVELYIGHISFLIQNRPADVVVCVIPNQLYDHLTQLDSNSSNDEDADSLESNFRRALKAKAMRLGKPLQLVVETTLEERPKGHQDDATRAWNLCTALYYKSHNTIPWRLTDNPNKPTVCYAGIGFYRSRDKSVLNTSMAQVFDELGNGIILRGDPVVNNKDDRHPYLTYEQSGNLLRRALREYYRAVDTSPSRLVLHKSSNFREEEIDGFRDVMKDERVRRSDFVTIMPTSLRLLRNGDYPPLRGFHLELTRKHIFFIQKVLCRFTELIQVNTCRKPWNCVSSQVRMNLLKRSVPRY